MKTSRTKPRNRCNGCEIRKDLCFCELIPKLSLSTRVVVLMHVQEKSLSTNTARLATNCLTNSEIRYRGLIGKLTDTTGLVSDRNQSLLLYPSPDAIELTPEYVASLRKPITLIVPDGSWRQAAKVHYREPELSQIPRIKLPPGPPSVYRLRQEPNESFVSTFEAIARVLGVLEGTDVQKALEKIFLIKVERTLWARGTLPLEQCTTGIPEKARYTHLKK